MAKRIFICVFIFILFLLCLLFTSKAETVNSIQTCNGRQCLTNISDVQIADSGGYFLLIDSGDKPYARKIDFASNTFTEDIILSLKSSNSNQALFKAGISKDGQKAFAFTAVNSLMALQTTQRITPGDSDLQNIEVNLQEQTDQGTSCRCQNGAYFDGTVCVTGSITCMNTTQDIVCSCDNLNFLNSCVAQANGVKTFTKAQCGSVSNLTCANDSQCPIGSCPSGATFKKYNCTNNTCQLIAFSIEPCTTSSSSSSSGANCRCSSGEYFNGTKCVSGKLTCLNTDSDPVCSCDDQEFLNSCAAQANGVKKFTKAVCGTISDLSCSTDDQCLLGTCLNGGSFKKFKCTSNKCVLAEYSSEPCNSLAISSSGALVYVIDLTSNSVNPIVVSTAVIGKGNSVSLVPSVDGINSASFLNPDGSQLIIGNNNSDSPALNIVDSETGTIKQSVSIPDVARSIEVSPDFKKAIVTFKDLFAQSIGIYSVSGKKLIKIDIPDNIFFKVDRFLSGVSFDLNSEKCVVSSQDGKHVLHLVDLKNSKLIVRFLNNKTNGKTLSVINPSGTTAVSAGNIADGVILYKVDASNLKIMRIVKAVKFADGGSALDVKITPDGNTVLVLLLKGNEKRLKMLNLKDLSLICEYPVSDSAKSSFLASDPYGRYLVLPDIQGDSVNLITDLNPAPVFRSIIPLKASNTGGTKFIINGYVDPLRSDGVKVCFGSEQFCATSVTVSSDGKIISGTTPQFPTSGMTSLLFNLKKHDEAASISSSGEINCSKGNDTSSKYKNVFLFE